jgi:hypothetical protein
MLCKMAQIKQDVICIIEKFRFFYEKLNTTSTMYLNLMLLKT